MRLGPKGYETVFNVVVAVGVLCLLLSAFLIFVCGQDHCDQMRLYCDLSMLEGPERRAELCDVIDYKEKSRSSYACESLLRALKETETRETNEEPDHRPDRPEEGGT